MNKHRKILLAVDDSEQAMSAVRYCSGAFPPAETAVVLFHVKAAIPESFVDLGKPAPSRAALLSLNVWDVQTKKKRDLFMAQAKDILLKAGFPDPAITVVIRDKKVGIARDILAESHNDYDATIIGRTGASHIREFIIGSVANKLVGKMPAIPIIVVGGNPDPKKVLIGFDGSPDAARAVAVVGELLDHQNLSISLCHVIRQLSLHLSAEMPFSPIEERLWINQATQEISPVIEEAKNQLIATGFLSSHISIDIMDEEMSRAKRLVQTAEAEGFGTIVVGRRGLSLLEEFVLGRVSTKVLHMAVNHAVWIV